MPEKMRRLSRLQWQITIGTMVLSALPIGLAFAGQYFWAQLAALPVLACFIASCVLAYIRYDYNRKRRSEILAQLDAERDAQLIELFDGARKKRNLPSDAQSRDGYLASLKEAEARANQDLPPGVKRRGGNNPNGKP